MAGSSDNSPTIQKYIEAARSLGLTLRDFLASKGIMSSAEMEAYCGYLITQATFANWRTHNTPGSPEWVRLGDKVGYPVEAANRWLEANMRRPRPLAVPDMAPRPAAPRPPPDAPVRRPRGRPRKATA